MGGRTESDKHSIWSHAESYRGMGLAAMIHRNRLKHILNLLRRIDLNERGILADFGCSDGYIISLIQKEIFPGRQWKFIGFDHHNGLLSKARARKLLDSEFHFFNLNLADQSRPDSFDIVTCFETIEHAGNYRNAFLNLYNSCRKGGSIVITVPNEKGFTGLLKYFGRKLSRRNAYSDFFSNKSEMRYILSLTLNRNIEVFRRPDAEGWSPHLGFDYRQFEEFVRGNFVAEQKLEITFRGGSGLNFSRLYIFRKLM